MDISTVLGICVALAAVVGGATLEGLPVTAIVQPTAAIIVLGGTIGGTLISFPLGHVMSGLKAVTKVFFPASANHEEIIKEIIGYAAKARKNGLISLEQDAQNIKDPFTKKGISLVVDGIDPQKLRETMEIGLAAHEEHAKVPAEVFEAAGGYAPTIGIIGAVLGLIHVMHNLSDASKLGEGIAVAFVATIYGLVTANVFCIPFSSKLKQRLKEELQQKEMIIEGLIAIQNGENPHFIEQKLRSFLGDAEKKKG